MSKEKRSHLSSIDPSVCYRVEVPHVQDKEEGNTTEKHIDFTCTSSTLSVLILFSMKGTSPKKLAQLLSMVETEKEMVYLLEDLLTHEELESITKRMELLWLLKEEIPQREIREQLGCGIATVTRGSRIYKYGTGILMNYILKQKGRKK